MATFIDSDGLLDNIHAAINNAEQYMLHETNLAPVVHAHWTDDGECSNCGGYQLFEKAADRYMYWRSTSAFCPLCGAIMDEEVNDGKSSEV